MAGRGAPTFLKRQKEQKRAARALAKREAKQARRDARTGDGNSDQPLDDDMLPEDLNEAAGTDDDAPAEDPE